MRQVVFLRGAKGQFSAIGIFWRGHGADLVDLSETPDECIVSFRSGFLKTALLLMKHRKEGRDLTNLTDLSNL